jgi:dUTP pyrophosphatase
MRIQFKRIHPDVQRPSRHFNAGAWDLYLPEAVSLQPWVVNRVKLGFATAFSDGIRAVLHDRSSMGAAGIHVFAGLIDCDYRGEWEARLSNSTPNTIMFPKGHAIVQVKFEYVPDAVWVDEDNLPASDRGTAGWGSSDRDGANSAIRNGIMRQ